jgi:thiamine biosynthesis lipoprotein
MSGRCRSVSRTRRSFVAPLVTSAVMLVVSACSGDRTTPPAEMPAPGLVTESHQTMGTEIHLTAWTPDAEAADAAFEAAFAEFDRLDAMMTIWRTESDISALNAAAGDHPVPVQPEVREVLRIAHEVSEWTDGRFDVTFGALAGLWKFDYQNQDNTIPDRSEILARLPLINYRDVVIDDQAGTAFVKRKGMSVNLGGIGKGYAVDRAVVILRQHGLRDFMIQAGGDMYVSGRRGDRPWRLGIQDPRGEPDQSFATVDLSDATFSTSGDYERFFIKDGRRYHHILDLSIGEPSQTCRSVTLVTDRAVIADALAKGVFVLSPADGMALIERLPGVDGVIVGSDNKVLVSSGLKDRFTLLAPPTDAP